MIELPRRRFIAGLGALIAAPAIVRVASIMPVKAAEFEDWTTWFTQIHPAEPISVEMIFRTSIPAGSWRQYNLGMDYARLGDRRNAA